MRIISGQWKGRRLQPPKNLEVRPTTDFAREALFNVLQHQTDFSDLKILDLFCGTGAIGLEFASRGVPEVLCVDKQTACLNFLSKAKQQLNASNLNLIRADVFIFLDKHNSSYDLIFADPPFDLPTEKYETLINKSLSLVSTQGRFILEHGPQLNINFLEIRPILQKKYGHVHFSFFEKQNP